jgi:hypothetical protein
MSDGSNDLNATIAALMESDESRLMQDLGTRAKAGSLDPAVSGSYTLTTSLDGSIMGPADELRKLGKRIFRRLHREAWELICGEDKDDVEDRDKLLGALKMDRTAAAAVLTGILIANLGLSPAVAPVVAVLVLKRVFSPVYEELCGAWKESLGE